VEVSSRKASYDGSRLNNRAFTSVLKAGQGFKTAHGEEVKERYGAKRNVKIKSG
jgi:hypothetical protein